MEHEDFIKIGRPSKMRFKEAGVRIISISGNMITYGTSCEV
jgi:hypothetical protein